MLCSAESILYLKLAESQGQFRVVDQQILPGKLKSPLRQSRHAYQASLLPNEAGQAISQITFPTGTLRHHEYPASSDPHDNNGIWAHRFVPQTSGEQWIRMSVPDGMDSGILEIRTQPKSDSPQQPGLAQPTEPADAVQQIPLQFQRTQPSPAEVAPAAEGALITLRESGPRDSRINIVVVAEGYRNVEEDQFIEDARRFANGLFGVEPLSNYRDFFNVYGIFVASQESGSDIPSQNIKRDTYFNSAFESYGISQLLTIPPNDKIFDPGQGTGKLNTLLRQVIPDYDLAAMLVNDGTYGGSGGSVLIVSTHPSSVEIARHEFGHSFAGLGDEYADPYPGYPNIEEPNTTRETVRERIKWRDWILPETPIPTPEQITFENQVGLFEGAHYHETGWYRPKLNCRMKALEQPFCEVCRERIVLRTFELTSVISSRQPEPQDTVVVEGDKIFGLGLTQPIPNTLSVSWKWNGQLLTNDTPSIRVSSDWTGNPDLNTLTAQVFDGTDFVRTDPNSKRNSTVSWTVRLNSITPPTLLVSALGPDIVIQWPASSSGFKLQQAFVLPLDDTAWSNVTAEPTVQDGSFRVLLPVGSGTRFFRITR